MTSRNGSDITTGAWNVHTMKRFETGGENETEKKHYEVKVA